MIKTWDEKTQTYKESYVGRVLKTWPADIQIMSDVWESGIQALVWNDEQNSPATINAIVYWGPESQKHTAEADATPEVIEKFRLYRFEQKKQELTGRVILESQKPLEGRVVTVTKGKTNRGETGKVFKTIRSFYKAGWHNSGERDKLGIALSDETVEKIGPKGQVWTNYKNAIWVWAHNVEVVNPEQYQDFSDVEETATAYADAAVEALKKQGRPY